MLSTEPYKGVRDFYPADQATQNYIFKTMRAVAESHGYLEYAGSILEPAELYKSKTSEEIVNEQTYTFKDRGDREVTLRPEMTPTVARMIAAKVNEISMPAKWFSIPNLFRYEKPQRGRVREHWQLNADIFGSNSFFADAEIILLAAEVMKKFGAKYEDFEIQINSRSIMNALYKKLGIPSDKSKIITRIIDKKEKISSEVFIEALEREIGSINEKLVSILNSKDGVFEILSDSPEVKYLGEVLSILEKNNLSNVRFMPTLTRGFDYYTGMVFEVFDTNKLNPRSLFGGGRYDNLIEELFGKKVSAVGFGMGDVTIRDFLETHNLLPQLSSTTKVWIAVAPETDINDVYKVARDLRDRGINVSVDISGRKVGDQIVNAEKGGVPFVMVVGNEELKSGKFTIRNMQSRQENNGDLEDMVKCAK